VNQGFALSEPLARVGVLIVHGIGDHREGEALTSFGEPLVNWMQEWMFGAAPRRRGRVRSTEARLQAAGNDKERPAYARLEFDVPGVDPNVPERDSWLLCEAHWGQIVQPPESFALMRWLWTRGPLVVYWHFYLNSRRQDLPRQSSRRDAYPFVALAMALGIQLAVGLGMLLLTIPIGAWRAGVLRVVRVLTLTLGDSYVVLERELQRAALVQRVSDALDWLTQRVERVVVIGHSQGAALAQEALAAASKAEKVSLLVTLGSGVEKLHFLKQVRFNRIGILHATLLAPLLVVALGLLMHGFDARTQLVRWEKAVAGGLGVAALVCWVRLRGALMGYRQLLEETASQLKLPSGIEWLDIYTRHDIVPMGAASLLAKAGVLTSTRTFNVGSYLSDHVHYFARAGGCLSTLWQKLADHAALNAFSATDRENLSRFTKHHRRDVLVLIQARIGIAIAAVGSTVAIRERLAGLGASVVLAINDGPLSDWLNPIIKLRDAAAWGLEHAGASRPSALTIANAALGAMAPLSGLFVWWLVFRAVMGALTAKRWRSVVRSVDALALTDTAWRFVIKSAVAVAAAYLPVLVAVLVYLEPRLLTVSTLNMTLTLVILWVFLLAGAWFTLAGPWLASRHLFNDEKSWSDRAGSPFVPLLLAVVFFGLEGWMESGKLREPDAIVAIYGVAWQVFALHRLRKRIRFAWLLAAILVPPVVVVARFIRATTRAEVNDLPYEYCVLVLGILGAAAFTKNRQAIGAACTAVWAKQLRRLRAIRLPR
jgi:hypothetical protein